MTRLAVWIACMFLGAATGATAVASGGGVRIKRVADPANYYPEAAKLARASASVILEVAVDANGHLVDVRVLETEPADDTYGFGAAAMLVARNSAYSNSRAEVATLRFRVRFDWKT